MDTYPIVQEELLTRIAKAEQLVEQIEAPSEESVEQVLRKMCWALVAYEITQLILRAEELLTGEALAQLQMAINADDETRWHRYRFSGWWLKELIGQQRNS
jgi:adenylyl- and sulfurtransferase ThiI